MMLHPFVLGEERLDCASDVVAKIQAAQKPRQEVVERLVLEYGMDMVELRKRPRFMFSEVDRFVESGEGKGIQKYGYDCF